jgi:hemoglobin/transferrin/lactoferrin receptor protein
VLKENVPLDHIPPVFGQTSLRMNFPRFKAEFFVRYNGWKRIENFSKSGEDNPQYALAQGYPSWYTLNLKTDYQLNKHLKVQAGVENILDVHYRNFASGISAPGRNLYVSLRANI